MVLVHLHRTPHARSYWRAPEFAGLFDHQRTLRAVDLETVLILARLDHGKRRGCGRILRQWTIGELKQEFCFVVRGDSTRLAGGFVGALLDVGRKHAVSFGDLGVEHPAKRIDYVRADRAERPAAHLFIGPPVPRAIRKSAVIGTKYVVTMTYGADGAGL